MQTKIKTSQNGITLIALVITIVVLIILAGIFISRPKGKNEIRLRAIQAKNITNSANVIEKIKLAIQSAKIKGLGKIEETELKKELTTYFGEERTGFKIAGGKNYGYLLAIQDDNYVYFINTTGVIEEKNYQDVDKALEEVEKLTIEEDNKNSYAIALIDDLGTRSTIYLFGNPNNQVASEISTVPTEIPKGSVLENTDAIIDTPSYETFLSNTANYVTYTVNKNGKYRFNITVDGNTTETTVVIKNIERFTSIEKLAEEQNLSYAGGKENAYNYKGAVVPKGYYVDTNSSVDTGLVVTDSADLEGYSTGNEWVWVPVNSIVGNDDYYLIGSGNMAGVGMVSYTKYSKLWSFLSSISANLTSRIDVVNPQVQPSATAGYREPAILTDTTYGENRNYNLINNRETGNAFENGTDVAIQYRDDYETMVASVDNYKGFYIGRYEITSNGEKPGTTLSNTNWYTFYNQCLTYGTDYTESGMIYGCLWDATMQWLGKFNYQVGYNENVYSKYGNYYYESVKIDNETITVIIKEKGTSQKLSTGQTSYTKSNSIYDLSGNCSEYTQEANNNNYRVFRGGASSDANSSYTNSASRSYNNPTTINYMLSSRPHIYIK